MPQEGLSDRDVGVLEVRVDGRPCSGLDIVDDVAQGCSYLLQPYGVCPSPPGIILKVLKERCVLVDRRDAPASQKVFGDVLDLVPLGSEQFGIAFHLRRLGLKDRVVEALCLLLLLGGG